MRLLIALEAGPRHRFNKNGTLLNTGLDAQELAE